MIKTIAFQNPYWEREDCIILRLDHHPYAETALMDIVFPFHEDAPKVRLTPTESLNLRNAIDELYSIKALPMPEPTFKEPPPPLFIGYHPRKFSSLTQISSSLLERMVETYRLTPEDMKFIVHQLQNLLQLVYPDRKD